MSRARATVRQLAGLAATYIAANPSFVPSVVCRAIGTNKSLKLQAEIEVDGSGAYVLAADNGKVKTFSDVDSVVRAMSKIHEINDGNYAVTVDSGALFASAVPSDIIASYEAQVIRLGKVKVKQQGVNADLASQLALMAGWDAGNAAQQARFEEVTAQKAAVVADIAAIDAEVARFQGLIGN